MGNRFILFIAVLAFASCKEEKKDTAITIAADCGCGAYYDSLVVIPNAFSPNDDGSNDMLRPFFYKIPDSYSLKILNAKDGNVVFTSSNVADGWDGKWNGTIHQGKYNIELDYAVGGKNYSKKMCVSVLGCLLNNNCKFLDQYIEGSGFSGSSLEKSCN